MKKARQIVRSIKTLLLVWGMILGTVVGMSQQLSFLQCSILPNFENDLKVSWLEKHLKAGELEFDTWLILRQANSPLANTQEGYEAFLKALRGNEELLKFFSEDVKRVRAWEVLRSTPLVNQVKWLQYIDNAVSTQGLKPAQAAISARVLEAIPSTTLYQNSNDLDALYDAALVAKNELITITNNIANNTNGAAGFRPDYDKDGNFLNGLKSRDRAIEKTDADNVGDVSRLVDIAGSKIIYETLDEVYSALESLVSNYRDMVIKVKDRFVDPTYSGYRDVLINLRMSNGHIVELRLHIRRIEDVAPQEHLLYEQRRSIEAQAKTEGRQLTLEEEATINALTAEARALYAAAWADILKNN